MRIFENPREHRVDPRDCHVSVSLYEIMNVGEEPDLFVCTLFDFMKILYLETPTVRDTLTLLESVNDCRVLITT